MRYSIIILITFTCTFLLTTQGKGTPLKEIQALRNSRSDKAAPWLPSKDSVIIRGKIAQDLIVITLFQTKNGRRDTLNTARTDKEQNFRFAFIPPYKGIYTLHDGLKDYRLYLAPGTHVNITLNDGNLILNSTNNTPTRLLHSWDNRSARVKKHALYPFYEEYSPEQFFRELDSLIAYNQHLAPDYTTEDSDFNKLMTQLPRFDIIYYALNFARTPAGNKMALNDFPEIYRHLFQNEDLKDNTLLELPYGTDLLSLYVRFAHKINPETNLDQILALFVNPIYKGEIVLQQIERLNSFEAFEELVKRYTPYLTLDDQKNRIKQNKQRLLPYKQGNKAFPFTFLDTKGKSVSLSDFKGKLVVLDVWATTCTPCIAEFPHLKELVKQFKGKEVIFIGIATDRVNQKDTWLKFVAEEQLPGIQLFAEGWNNSLCKDYQIQSIPRYMLFDKEGNIITINAPLPSSPKLKELIEENL